MRNTKNEHYHRLLKSYKWQTLRARYLTHHPVCEFCEKKNKTSLAKVVHHVIPIEDAKDISMMEALAFDENNLMALCEKCHEEIHEQLGSRFKARKTSRRAEAQRIANDFMNKWCK
jgi:5-methylcytosine-specific restriction endonuclease McrA